ncbi:MBL fold metallo-hydrolase [Paenibacillus sp. MBLB4367]|uniref:MBL fold metallo-hydrolase n=1 Tax=Paenibacillus sp. MBLB4367 TaxID=3384767 RepID=UPI0039082163
MDISLVMLGTGSAFAKTFYNNNALVACNDYKLLLDCGHTAPRALHELNIGLDAIDGIFISHMHADHIGGLEEVAFRSMYTYKRKLSLFLPETLIEPLWEHSLKGTLENRDDQIYKLDDYFRIVPLREANPITVTDGFTLEIVPTIHIPGKPSYGVFLNEFVYYSADAVLDIGTLERLRDRGCRHILHECQLHPPGYVHATLESLLEMPEDLQRMTYLMHYDDDMETFAGRTGHMTFIKQHEAYMFMKKQ